MDYFTIIITSYLLGSIPFGLLLSKLAGLGDIREIGSGNIGATNVLRTGNKKIAALTLILDMLKGFVLTYFLIVAEYQQLIILLAGFFALLGHIFPVWLSFKGGKGVATFLGVILALSPFLFVICIVIWAAVFYISKISSLSALLMLTASPIFALLFNDILESVVILLMAALVIIRHKDNIQRLLQGKEGKVIGDNS